VKVTQQDGGLAAGDSKNQEGKEDEAKHVVHLSRPAVTSHTGHTHIQTDSPYAIEDKEQLYEDTTKW